MTRRRIALLCLLAGALLAALVPWTVRSDRVVAALARQVQQSCGMSVAADGPLTFTLLPMPQFLLAGVRLASADGVFDAQAEELRGQLRLLPLLQAQLRLRKVSVTRSRIIVTLTEQPAPSVAGTLTRLRGRIGTEPDSRWVPRIDRFVLTDAQIDIRAPTGRDVARLDRASLVMNSPEPDGDIDITASADWKGETAVLSVNGLDLAAIRAGTPQDVEVNLAGRMGRLSLDGRLTWSDRPLFVGTMRGQTPSISRFARWSGLGADLGDVERNAAIGAVGSVDLDKAEWPQATLDIGRDRLEGALAVHFGPRPQVRATFAAGDLDLGWLWQIVDPLGPERLRADYDLRLSATSVGLGTLRFGDAAMSAQTSARAIEVSLGRAGFAGGSLRGRVSAVIDGEGREIRTLGWAEGVDLERVLGDLAGVRGIAGTAIGQFTFEVSGDRSGGLARQLRGSASIEARDGDLSGTAFTDAANRSGQSLALPDWKTGRIRFGQAVLGLEFEHGQAVLSNGVILTTGTRSQLSGRVDLATRNAALRLVTEVLGGGMTPARPPFVIDLNGPLQRLTLGTAAEAAASP